MIPDDVRRAVLAEAGDRAASRVSVEAPSAETTRPERTRRDAAPVDGATAEPQPRTDKPRPPTPDGRRQLRAALASRGGLRQAVLLQEILGRPRALRTHGDDAPGA